MAQKFSNNANAKLAAAVAPGDTSLTVVTGQGAKFPTLSGSDFCIATLQSEDGATIEIVKVTAKSTDTFTIVRAQEGTSAGTFAALDAFELRLTGGGAAGFVQGPASATDSRIAAFDGTTGNVVKDSGSLVSDLVPKSLVTTKGDVIVASGSAAPARLGIGTDGQVLTADSTQATGTKWANVQGLSSRTLLTKVSGSLANGATETGTVTLAKTTALLQLIVDRGCRVILYATNADLTADSGRSLGTPATPGTGVLAEFSPGAATTIDTGPCMILYNGDGSPTTSIYYSITNLSGSTSTVQVQFEHLKLEA